MELVFDFLTWLAVIAGVGRALLAFLPPGRVGSHRLADLPETLFVSAMLGSWVHLVPFSLVYFELAPRSEVAAIVALVLVAAAALLRILLRPHALVPQHELPRSRWGRLEWALALAFAFAVLWHQREFHEVGALDVFERVMQAAWQLAAACHVVRAVECAGRPAWLGLAVALAALTPQSPLGFGGDTLLLQIQYVVLGVATSLAGWLRRADSRDRALALFASGALAGIDVRLAVAGMLATVGFTHSNAVKPTLRATVLTLAFVAAPTVWAASDVWRMFHTSNSERTFFGAPVSPLLPLGAVTLLVVASVFLTPAASGSQPAGRFAGRGREVGAIASFCALPPLLAALQLAVPELVLPGATPLSLEALVNAVAPAALFLAAISLVPPRKP